MGDDHFGAVYLVDSSDEEEGDLVVRDDVRTECDRLTESHPQDLPLHVFTMYFHFWGTVVAMLLFDRLFGYVIVLNPNF